MKWRILEVAITACLIMGAAHSEQEASDATQALSAAKPAKSAWPPRTDEELRAQVFLPVGKVVIFRDAHGAKLTEGDFLAALPSAGSFSMNGDDATVIQLTLSAPGSLPPKKTSFQISRGDMMPALAGTTLDGKPFGSHEFLDRVTLVNFVYAGCTYCIEEVPVLNQFAAENPSIQTVAITYDDPVLMEEFVTKWHFHWPVVAGQVDYVKKLGLWVYPSLALIDANGRLVGYDASAYVHKKNQALTTADIVAWVARISAGEKHDALATGKTSPLP